jgi:hypothetical protein
MKKNITLGTASITHNGPNTYWVEILLTDIEHPPVNGPIVQSIYFGDRLTFKFARETHELLEYYFTPAPRLLLPGESKDALKPRGWYGVVSHRQDTAIVAWPEKDCVVLAACEDQAREFGLANLANTPMTIPFPKVPVSA